MSSVAQVRGSLAGAAILTLFGSVWCLLALASWSARPGWSIPAGVAATLVLLGWGLARLIALRGVRSVEDPVAAARGKRAGMWFGIIFGIEGGLIALCSVVLAHMGLDVWIPLAAAVIIGLHFLPLARLFEMPIYYWTGVAAVVGMLGCSLIGDPNARVRCAALAMAAILWLTSAAVLIQSRHTWLRQAEAGAGPER